MKKPKLTKVMTLHYIKLIYRSLLFRWEFTLWKYPERFSENTNQYMSCSNCTEKLCVHKKQLMSLRQQLELYAEDRVTQILTGIRGKTRKR
ncbi:MAG: hypothetical protein MJ127_00670 [Mogibacterium sp.]|nr:hypothetical protein [Mogibacterium sp.]